MFTGGCKCLAALYGVKMRETFYGPEHALVAPSLEKQALLELTAGREAEAADLLKKCLLMQEERCVI